MFKYIHLFAFFDTFTPSRSNTIRYYYPLFNKTKSLFLLSHVYCSTGYLKCKTVSYLTSHKMDTELKLMFENIHFSVVFLSLASLYWVKKLTNLTSEKNNLSEIE